MVRRGAGRLAVVGVMVLVGCTGDEAATPSTTSTLRESTTTTTRRVPSTLPAGPDTLDGVVVVVDPGHNGRNAAHAEEISRPVDAGGFSKDCNTTGTATDAGYSESRFNFAVALLVEDELAALGASVHLTRDDDDGWGPCIDERGLLGHRVGADVVVSIHADGGERQEHGFHVIHPSPRKGYVDQATTERSAALAVVIRDTLVRHGLVPSTYAGTDGLDQRDDLGTLNRAGVPAVIVESGNMRNAADAAMLTSTEGQEVLAGAIVAALVDWFGKCSPEGSGPLSSSHIASSASQKRPVGAPPSQKC